MSAPDSSDIILTRLMSLHPKVIDLTLERMHRILAALGHPEASIPPAIHIAGTNGKGSTQAMIRAGLEAADELAPQVRHPEHRRVRVAGFLPGVADGGVEFGPVVLGVKRPVAEQIPRGRVGPGERQDRADRHGRII